MDIRHTAKLHKWWAAINERNMTAKVTSDYNTILYDELYNENINSDFYNAHTQEFNLPFKYIVCPVCEGRGYYCNPSIDSQGISEEEFDEDPDFREEYMGGAYDMPCELCNGDHVIPQCIDIRADIVISSHIEKKLELEAEYEYEKQLGY